MRLWGYYAGHTFVNNIKKMFRSTVLIVILAVVGIGVIFGLVGGVIGTVIENQESTEISTEDSTEVTSGGEEESEDEKSLKDLEEQMSPEEKALEKAWLEAIAALVLLVVLLWGLYSGSKSGTDIFMMADVNFLFTAPMKPQTVLLFRLSFQMVAAFAASLYLVFQVPNLMINAGLGASAVAAMFVGYIMLLIFQRLMMVLSYTVFTTYGHMKKYVLPFVIGIVLFIFGALTVVFFAEDRSVNAVVQTTFGSRWMRMVPVIGWYKGMIMCAVNRQFLPFLGYLILLIVSMAVLVFIIWHIKADFYEDAFSAASKTAEMVEDAQQGRVAAKKRSDKISRTGSFGGEGAGTFFTKEVYCRKRMAKFGFLTNTMLFYLGVGLVLGMITMRLMDSHSFMLTGCVILAILFFRNMGNPIEQETSMNWLYLVPDNPYKKVFFTMMAGTYSCGIDLLPGVVLGAVLVGANPGIVLLWLLTLIVVDFMLSSVGLVLEVIFPESALDLVKSVIEMFLRLGMILVLTGLMAGGYLLGGEVAALLLTLVASAVVGGICFIIYPSLLHCGK